MSTRSGGGVFPHNGRMDAELDAVARRYARFASEEAPGRSEVYEQWAAGVAADADVQRVLARIPETHRQPPLLFAVTRMLGSGDGPFPAWRSWLLAHADDVVRACANRSLQTNEPLRCAALLPALSAVAGPIALLEVGASAGLCLFPDRYSYRYRGAAGTCELDPVSGPSAVVLECEVRGARMPQVRVPEIVWRAGIDLNPLDPRAPETAAWLGGLVWPGETGRARRVTDALAIAAAEPPLLVQGDAVDLLAEVAARAPKDATLVVQTPGVLVHIPRARRLLLIERVRSPARWLTIDPPGLHEGWNRPIDPAGWPGFAVALDGDVSAAADPLGRWWEWRGQR